MFASCDRTCRTFTKTQHLTAKLDDGRSRSHLYIVDPNKDDVIQWWVTKRRIASLHSSNYHLFVLIYVRKFLRRYGNWTGYVLQQTLLRKSIWSFTLLTLWSFHLNICFFPQQDHFKDSDPCVTLYRKIVFDWEYIYYSLHRCNRI